MDATTLLYVGWHHFSEHSFSKYFKVLSFTIKANVYLSHFSSARSPNFNCKTKKEYMKRFGDVSIFIIGCKFWSTWAACEKCGWNIHKYLEHVPLCTLYPVHWGWEQWTNNWRYGLFTNIENNIFILVKLCNS